MKTIIILSLFILVSFSSSCQQEKSPIEGTWEMVYGKWIRNDTNIFEFPGNIKGYQLCMYSKNYYMWSTHRMFDTIPWDQSGGSTYQFDENKYEETLLYHRNPDRIGRTSAYELVIKNDTLTKISPRGEIEVYIRKD